MPKKSSKWLFSALTACPLNALKHLLSMPRVGLSNFGIDGISTPWT